jgi:uncharacterized protein (TIGR03435 family)
MAPHPSKQGAVNKRSNMRGLVVATGVAIRVLIPLAGYAQSETPKSTSPSRFEVATIRPADSSHGGQLILIPRNDALVTIKGMTLRSLIRFAYSPSAGDLPSRLVIGCPSWCDHDGYDILAKPEGHTIPSQRDRRLMLRTLLEERFQLKVHYGTTISPVFALVVAKSGLRMKGSSPEADGSGGFLNCGRGCLSGQNVSMDMLAGSLQMALESSLSEDPDDVELPVLNKTGLRGGFDIKLRWSQGPAGDVAGKDGTTTPDIFAALQEQLGLKLQREKASVETIIIDRAERPTPN